MFDTGYLLTEVSIDNYLEYYEIPDIDKLSIEEQQMLTDVSTDLQNRIPKPKKIEIHNTLDQAKIVRYHQKLVEQYITWPSSRSTVS